MIQLSLLLVVLAVLASRTTSFSIYPSQLQQPYSKLSTNSELSAIYSPGRSSSLKGGKDERSKRQFRVGELVRTELANILHTGNIKGRDATYLEPDVRQRISVVSVDVSPDLRQARVVVSIRNANPKQRTPEEDEQTMYYEEDAAVDKRRAFSWLVENTKSLRHTLAQRMSHMKTSSPNLTFHQVDVAAATDVMYLIEKVSKGYTRESIGEYEFLGEFDEDEDDELGNDEDWDEMDEDFFDTDDDDDE
jgi:ribosome-binding factor A